MHKCYGEMIDADKLQCNCFGLDGTFTVVAYHDRSTSFPSSSTAIYSFSSTSISNATSNSIDPTAVPLPLESSTTPLITFSTDEALTTDSPVWPPLQMVLTDYVENSLQWLTAAPNATLTVLDTLVDQYNVTGHRIPFRNVPVIVAIVKHVVEDLPAFVVTANPVTVVDIVDATIAIFNALLQLDFMSGMLERPTNLDEARRLEQDLYGLLERMPGMLPVREAPYEFYQDLVAMVILRRMPGPDATFEELTETRSLSNVISVREFETRKRLRSNFSFVEDERNITEESIVNLRITVPALQKDFEAASKWTKNSKKGLSFVIPYIRKMK